MYREKTPTQANTQGDTMTRTTQNRDSGRSRKAQLQQVITTAAMTLALVTPDTAQAQQAIGVPFVGRNHLSFSVTELSRDGIELDRKAVFGGIYGRRLGRDEAPVQYSVIVRAAARAMEATEDAIAEAGFSVAGTHQVRALPGLSVTGAAGLSAVVWSQENGSGPERSQLVAGAPITAGVAYDIRLGRATIAPFISLSSAYSTEREHLGDDRVARHDGWRWTNSTGVSVRFREAVLTLSEINRERGMPHRNRVLFSAGMSW